MQRPWRRIGEAVLQGVLLNRLVSSPLGSQPQVLVLQLVDRLLDVRGITAVLNEEGDDVGVPSFLLRLLLRTLWRVGDGVGRLGLEVVLLDLEASNLSQAGLQLGVESLDSVLGLLGLLVRSLQLQALEAHDVPDLGKLGLQVLDPLLGGLERFQTLHFLAELVASQDDNLVVRVLEVAQQHVVVPLEVVNLRGRLRREALAWLR
jgi:hypothetical protein